MEVARPDRAPPYAARSRGCRTGPPGRARARPERRARSHAGERACRAVSCQAERPRVQGLSARVASELTMPKLSDSMADAVIVRWLKSPGEAFERGDGLIEVETDKATVVYEAESTGTIGSILVPEGATVAIGEPIATLANGDRATEGTQRPAPAKAEPEAAPSVAPAAAPPREDGSNAGRPNATPVARRTAVELGVSLYGLTGTGTGGRITREDVRRAAESGAEKPRTAGGRKGDVRQ